jgi:hypothetical protein
MSEELREDALPPRETSTHFRSIQDWAASSGEDSYRIVHPEEAVRSPKPKGLDSGVDTFDSFLALTGSEAYVALVPGGRLCGDHANCAVLTADGRLIWDVSFGHEQEPDDHWLFHQAELPPITSTSEAYAALTIKPVWSSTYYHWMFEVLPRFELLWRAETDVDNYVLHPHPLPFQQETLRILGVQNDVIETTGPFHVEPERLVVPSYVPSMAPTWACEFLRRTFLKNGASSADERLYISRATAPRGRRVENEERVLEILTRFGFRSIELDSLSVADQAELFAAAECVVAPHGAGLTNLVFCRPGTTVIELFAPRYVHPMYWMVSSRCRLEYHYLVGTGERAKSWATWPTEGGLDPIVVDEKDLLEILKIAGVSSRSGVRKKLPSTVG